MCVNVCIVVFVSLHPPLGQELGTCSLAGQGDD